jgi:DNA uptake protein ComE-like DNA-binding protein
MSWAAADADIDTSRVLNGPVLLNTATLQEIQSLPISPDLAKKIWDYVYYQGPFKSVYELRQIPGMDQVTFDRLKPLVQINPPVTLDTRAERVRDAYDRLEELASEEGASSSLAEEWIERMVDPLNVNTATLDELESLENVSPIDALAIWRQVREQGNLQSARDLRSVPGLSSWGYSNARRYLGYEETTPHMELHGRYQFLSYDTPYFSDEDEIIRWEAVGNPRPDLTHKLQLSIGRHWSGGIQYHRNFGEGSYYFQDEGIRIPEMKGFVSARNIEYKGVTLNRVVLGNYRVSFGQGLVVDNTDIWSPRFTGYGWNPRLHGIAPDLSRSQECAFRGIALEASWKNLRGVGFFSSDRKDAILNPDGSINRLVTLVPRIDYDIYPERWATLNGDTVFVPSFEGDQSMLDAVREVALGGQLRYGIMPGIHVGVQALEVMYDRPLHPTLGEPYWVHALTEGNRDTLIAVYPLMDPTELDEIADSPQNSEALSEYSSDAESGLWENARSARRIYGVEAAATFANVALQGEVAQMNTDGIAKLTIHDPIAAVVSGYLQYNTMNLLVLYRHYDVAFDNPYNRGFANYRRYKGATFEDSYYLRDETFGSLFVNNASPQAEDGIFVSSRFQVARPLVLGLELDNWTRLGDGIDYYRWVVKTTYRPIWPLQIYLRQRFQARGHLTIFPTTGYDGIESRLEVRFNLSLRDRLDMLYTTSTTRWPPRPRLSGDVYPDGMFPINGNEGTRSEAVGATMTHHVSDRLSFKAFGGIYHGFLWTFEDTDFTVVDGDGFRWWFAVDMRPSTGVALSAKVTSDNQLPITYVSARNQNDPVEPTSGYIYTADNVRNRTMTYRLQLLYFF